MYQLGSFWPKLFPFSGSVPIPKLCLDSVCAYKHPLNYSAWSHYWVSCVIAPTHLTLAPFSPTKFPWTMYNTRPFIVGVETLHSKPLTRKRADGIQMFDIIESWKLICRCVLWKMYYSTTRSKYNILFGVRCDVFGEMGEIICFWIHHEWLHIHQSNWLVQFYCIIIDR